ncbi:MAG: transposase, partial [Thermodesulfobacteriota bacterium]|nr:transposase [Thermodesulfobacteriota bacterium]
KAIFQDLTLMVWFTSHASGLTHESQNIKPDPFSLFRWRTMTLPVMEFIRRFLQHALPRGFHKVRYMES